jgi:hypothetical protein
MFITVLTRACLRPCAQPYESSPHLVPVCKIYYKINLPSASTSPKFLSDFQKKKLWISQVTYHHHHQELALYCPSWRCNSTWVLLSLWCRVAISFTKSFTILSTRWIPFLSYSSISFSILTMCSYCPVACLLLWFILLQPGTTFQLFQFGSLLV